MTHKKPHEATGIIVELLSPFSPDDRQRVVQAAMTLLGEATPTATNTKGVTPTHDDTQFPTKAKLWMAQNGMNEDDLAQTFHFESGAAQIIASEVPGKSDKEKTLNCYLLAGAAKLLSSGTPQFDDKFAREVCKTAGCYDPTNHSTRLKEKRNELTGSKDTGWTVTAPGLKQAAALVKSMAG